MFKGFEYCPVNRRLWEDLIVDFQYLKDAYVKAGEGLLGSVVVERGVAVSNRKRRDLD